MLDVWLLLPRWTRRFGGRSAERFSLRQTVLLLEQGGEDGGGH